MDEKKTPAEKQREEPVPQDRALTDQEAEKAAGGRPPASAYRDHPFF